MENIYLDNGATSFPKPKEVIDSMTNYISNIGGNINRSSSSLSLSAENIVYETREKLCSLFNFDKPENLVFTGNITTSLNVILKGYLKPGDHVIVSSMEHNAVMRPLNSLSQSMGITYSRVQCNAMGELNPKDILPLIKPNTKAVVMTHGSNVCGTVLPYLEIGEICRNNNLTFIADTAQTAGCIPIDMKAMNIGILCFTGHKSLLGPQGTGGFVIDDRYVDLVSPLIEGGTGSLSEHEIQPEYMPDKYEGGTLNIPGIFGLNGALKYIFERGIENIRNHELELSQNFINGIMNMDNLMVAGNVRSKERTGVVSINFKDMDNGEVAYMLSKNYGISTRCGLHCAPSAHKTLGTFPDGTVRFSFGAFNTQKEVEYTLAAINNIIKK